MSPEKITNLTERDAEHIELIHMLKVSLENTRKLLEMWERECGKVEKNNVSECEHDFIITRMPGTEFTRSICHKCGLAR